jgi:hypothetical protein
VALQRIIRKFDELNKDSLTIAHIRTATIVRLPFHLCTGSIFQVVDPENDCFQVWLRNKLSIPHNADIQEQLNILHQSHHDEFFTDALIINNQPELRPGEFEAIRADNASAIGSPSLRNPGFKLINEISTAHHMVRLGPYISGINASWPRLLTEHEIIERILVEIVLLADPNRTIDKNMVLILFADIDQLPFEIGGSSIGDFKDYSREQLESLRLAIRKVRNHAFYELKTNAISAMLVGDSIVAIVLACAALEGAHGAFVRLTLRDKFPGDKDFNKFINGLLRDHGFYSLVQFSIRVLMKTEERPSDDELKRCLNGITIRNAIMHAGIKGTGKYKIREFSRNEINSGYSGIMKVYKCFEVAVECQDKLL